MPVSPTQAALAIALLFGLGFIWYYAGRGRWRRLLEERFLYGVPWGTLVTVAVVVAFYLLAQGGLRDWSSPVMLPYVTWSYLYPTGLLTAGIAHGSPAHLVSNVTATLVLAPIAEYAWSHYSPAWRAREDARADERDPRTDAGRRAPDPASATDPDAESTSVSEASPRDGTGARETPSVRDGPDSATDDESDPRPDGGGDSEPGVLDRPWVRALVAFPSAMFALALVTSTYSLGPGLGFSGVVYAVAGFAVVVSPVRAVVGIVGASALGTLYEALARPVVRETIDAGAPGPPGWAGIGFQAHLLGFLLGVALAVALVRYRGRRPSAERVFFATLLFGMVQSLWLLAWPGRDDVYYLYQGIGVTLVLLLTVLVTLAAAGSDGPLLGSRSPIEDGPTPRQLAAGWLFVVGLIFVGGLAGVALGGELAGLLSLSLVTALLALPALPSLRSGRWTPNRISRRGVAVTCLLVVAVVVALPSVPVGMVVVDDDTVPGSGDVVVGEYAVTYEENATSGQRPAIDLGDDPYASQQSGVIVVSPDREIWTVGVPEYELEHEGEASVEVGSVGWGETVRAERSGWEVAGGESAYVVDLAVDGETTRSFESDPVRAETVVDGREIGVAPGADAFHLEVTANDSAVGTAPIPEAGEMTTVGGLRFATETVDGVDRLFVEADDTRAQIAERETYD